MTMARGYRASRRALRRLMALVVLAALVVPAAITCEISVSLLGKGWGKSGEFIRDFFPPLWSAMDEMAEAAAVTLLLAAAATLLGVLFSFPVGLAAARNVVPGWLRLSVRVLVGIERALPEVLSLLFLVVAFGLGPFAGIIALAIGSVGMLGKLLADAIEEVDPRVQESVEATGATRWQMIRYALIPELLPAILGNALFRFDVNVRSSIVLGAVGAGGVGQEIHRSMGMLQYDRATLAVLCSLALILASERLSDYLRGQLLRGGALR